MRRREKNWEMFFFSWPNYVHEGTRREGANKEKGDFFFQSILFQFFFFFWEMEKGILYYNTKENSPPPLGCLLGDREREKGGGEAFKREHFSLSLHA